MNEDQDDDFEDDESERDKELVFTLELRCYDPDELFDAALRRLIEDGVDEEDAKNTLKPDGEIDVCACAQMILDPGSLDGCSIHNSSCEEVL